jgi:phosphate transport system protein
VHNLGEKVPKADARQLIDIVQILQKMVEQIKEGFTKRELDPASYVLRADHEIDRVYKSFFRRHLQGHDDESRQEHAELLLIAQALERAGDHATNLAEELFRLIEGRSLRHIPKKQFKD